MMMVDVEVDDGKIHTSPDVSSRGSFSRDLAMKG